MTFIYHTCRVLSNGIWRKKKGESDVKAPNTALIYPPISDWSDLEVVAKPAYTLRSRQHSSFSSGCINILISLSSPDFQYINCMLLLLLPLLFLSYARERPSVICWIPAVIGTVSCLPLLQSRTVGEGNYVEQRKSKIKKLQFRRWMEERENDIITF